MKFKSNIGSKFAAPIKAFTSGLSNPASWMMEYFGSNNSSTGTNITVQSVLGIPEVWNAVCKISGHVASMPLEAWRESPSGEKKRVRERGVDVWNNPPNFTGRRLLRN